MTLLPTLLILLLTSPATAQIVGGDWQTHYQFDGPIADAHLGKSVSNAGDVNADGFDDLIVGAPNAGPGGLFSAGSVFVYSGADGSTLYQFDGSAASNQFGYSVSNAGDVNADGFDDLIVGAKTASPGGVSQSGSAFVYSGADGSTLYQFDGLAADDFFGNSVSNAGDINADGFDDVIVGAWGADPGGLSSAGSVFVYSGANGSILYRFNGLTAGSLLGVSVSNAGDVNNDGFDDMIIGADHSAPGGRASAGSAFVYSGANGAILFQFDGASAYDWSGWAVSNAGDVNNDGFGDLIVSAHGADPGGLSNAGSVSVYSGSNGATLYQFDGSNADERFGLSVSNAGDVNSDGFDDIMVGAAFASPGGQTSAGSVFVYSGANGSTLYQFNGSIAYDYFGHSVSNAGDVTADGVDNLIVGAISTDPGGLRNSGSAFVFNFHPFLTSNSNSISAASGGTTSFELAFPLSAANMPYRVLFSASGTGPAFYGIDLPLSPDAYARNSFRGNYPFPTHTDMQGTLSASATAAASFSVPANALSGAIGRTLNFAAVVIPTGQLPSISSVAVAIEIFP